MEELPDGYKSQQRVERGFRFLKDPEFFADSIFFKTSERIEALLMVTVTTLFVYSATEYLPRKNLKENDSIASDWPTDFKSYHAADTDDFRYESRRKIFCGW